MIESGVGQGFPEMIMEKSPQCGPKAGYALAGFEFSKGSAKFRMNKDVVEGGHFRKI